MTPARLVWLAGLAFGGGFGALAVLRHRAFDSGRFDLGNMTQAVWSTAQGDVLSVTDVHGEQISRLGSHFDPILAALAPLWWLWPSPELLLVVQALAVASGALPVFWLGRKHLDGDGPAAALALAYLLLPPVQWLTVSDFHAVALACPLLLFAWWFLDERRLLPFALAAAAALLTKEHIGLAVAGMGAWYAVRYRVPRTGGAIAIAGGGVALAAILVVIPHYAPTGVSAFESRYDSPSLDGRDLSYLAALLLPLALLPLAAPLALLAALPELALNLFSSTVTQTSVKSHYAAAAAPALLAAAVFGAARVGARAAYLAALAALAGAVLLGPAGRVDVSAGPHEAAARRAVARVPEDAAVSATNALGAHLSARSRIFSFPVLREAEWVAVDTRQLSFLDSLDGDRARPALAKLRADPSWRLVFAEDGILVLRRR
ncbi:MAG: DUF2079 domain-containing protein [Gaiellaceae bacterium]